jgi:Polyprenyltransferase (cytochrome oxidase assembly factor)
MKNNSGNRLIDYLRLSKLTIMLPVSLTGFTGYFIFNPHFSIKLILVSFGILLMAISASTFNQIQEFDIDSKMERTTDRPIPAGKIKLTHAIIFSICNLVAGMSIIYSGGNLLAALIGLFTIFWYNGIYTYSKRITAFAVVPGALTGALPPLIGWVAAGGGILDKPILFLEFLFFTGQIPHFWLFILNYGEEYNKAGIPALTDIFNKDQINRLTFTWVLTSVIAAIFLCYFEIIRTGALIGILLIASTFLIWEFSALIKSGVDNETYKKYSILLDSYFLLVLLLLISDRIIS